MGGARTFDLDLMTMRSSSYSYPPQSSANGSYKPKLFVDGANGVGAGKLKAMIPFLGDSLDVTIVNDGTSDGDILNHQCGADFVKVRFAFSGIVNFCYLVHLCNTLLFVRLSNVRRRDWNPSWERGAAPLTVTPIASCTSSTTAIGSGC